MMLWITMMSHPKMILFMLLFQCLIYSGCSQYAALSPQNNAKKNLWPAIQASFTLTDETYHPRVIEKIKWYQSHQSTLERALIRAKPYLYFIHHAIQTNHLPGELILVPIIESEYSPFAYSWAGATGLWQLMPGTGSGMHLKINWWLDERRDIIQSTHAALNYTSYLKDFFDGDFLLALAAYDSGAGRIQSALKTQHQTDFWSLKLPRETADYIPKLLALKAMIQHPETYKIQLPFVSNQPYFKAITMHKPIDLHQAAQLAHISTNEMRQLNPAFRRWSTLPKGEYTLLLPINRYDTFVHNLHLMHFGTPAKQITRHQVKPHENLSSIAAQHGLSVRRLSEINQLHSAQLKPGQYILIPRQTPHKLPGFSTDQTLKIAADHAPGPQRYVHLIHPNESLQSIAKSFGVNPKELMFWNQLKKPEKIKPGNHLVIWKKSKNTTQTKFYVVRKGDNLSKICARLDCSIQAVRRHNNLSNIDHLKINQVEKVR